jgi:hypothetical protein
LPLKEQSLFLKRTALIEAICSFTQVVSTLCCQMIDIYDEVTRNDNQYQTPRDIVTTAAALQQSIGNVLYYEALQNCQRPSLAGMTQARRGPGRFKGVTPTSAAAMMMIMMASPFLCLFFFIPTCHAFDRVQCMCLGV